MTVLTAPVISDDLRGRGYHYNSSNGVFTAPVDGFYTFGIQSIGWSSSFCHSLHYKRNWVLYPSNFVSGCGWLLRRCGRLVGLLTW